MIKNHYICYIVVYTALNECSIEEVVEHLENLFSELSVKPWFNDNESLVLANLIRKANEDIFLSKKTGQANELL